MFIATEVQLQREMKAAFRGVAEVFGYSVLRSEQADATKSSFLAVMSLYLCQLAQGREPMFCQLCLLFNVCA